MGDKYEHGKEVQEEYNTKGYDSLDLEGFWGRMNLGLTRPLLKIFMQ